MEVKINMVGQSLDDKNLSILMKVISVLFGAGIALIGVLDYVFWEISSPIEFMLAGYFVIFGVVGGVCEFPVPKLALYISFLKSYLGKGVYFIL